MTWASDDLTPALIGEPRQAVGFRQGKVVAWNRITAENTVDVGGAQLSDVPILNTTEASQLAAGDTVALLTFGSTWWILGRVTIPGTPQAASALAAVFSRITAARDDTSGTRNDEDFGDLTGSSVGPSVTVQISDSGRALVFWSVDVGQSVEWRSRVTGGTSVAVSGATTLAASGAYSFGPNVTSLEVELAGGLQGAMMHLFTGLNPGSNTFTLKYRTIGEPGDVSFADREIAVLPM